tara:strand:+ start:113 stop:565 length:453 start_codon:yes stop_codon:yes gene_type:complete
MARIIAYQQATPDGEDLLLGTQKTTGGTNQTNPTKNFTVDAVVQAGVGYTAYTALLTQAGAAAPVATVLKNNTGYTYTWARTGGGTYTITANGSAFTVNKTIVFNNNGIDVAGGNTPPQWTRTSDTVITLTTGGIDTAMQNASFEVRIYS